MHQIVTIWTRLDRRRRIVLIASVAAVLAGFVVLTRIAATPSMALLYAGLEGESAGETMRALEQRGVKYRVQGDMIFVPASRRDELRMALAAEGLPSNGVRGYELLDGLSGFGTTSQMFDAAYWRAKEGELARTIVASPNIGQARVHIASAGADPFRRAAPVTASVSVVPSGDAVSREQARAIRHLVASAVSGLVPARVAVVDANGALIGDEAESAGHRGDDERARILRDRVARLLEARVGKGNAVVEVSVETVTESRSVRERRIDPESRVAISTDTEERADSSSGPAGDVTVASNLPDGDTADPGGTQSRNSSTRERVNYEVSQTDLEVVQAPGAIRRLTVAVLVNGLPPAEDGAFRPRPEEELAALQELVASAVGYDADRGDVITIKSMELPAASVPGALAVTSLFQRLGLDAMALIRLAALAVVTVLLGLFVVRPIAAGAAALPASDPVALPPAGAAAGDREVVHTGEIDDGNHGFSQPTSHAGDSVRATPPALGGTSATGDPVERLRMLIGDKQEESVEILRSWLAEAEEKNR